MIKIGIKNIVLLLGILLIGGCTWGRYPCPEPVEEKNSEKDGTGITLIEIKRNKDGTLKKKQPRRIRKKK